MYFCFNRKQFLKNNSERDFTNIIIKNLNYQFEIIYFSNVAYLVNIKKEHTNNCMPLISEYFVK